MAFIEDLNRNGEIEQVALYREINTRQGRHTGAEKRVQVCHHHHAPISVSGYG